MTQVLIAALYETPAEARHALDDLAAADVPTDAISLVAVTGEGDLAHTPSTPSVRETGKAIARDAGLGAASGGALGAIAGLLAGAAALAVPGIGPVVAAGPIAAMLAGAGVGAATGGLIGALVSSGVPHEMAGDYAEAVRRGAALLTVSADESQAGVLVDLLDRHGALDLEEHRARWREDDGWQGFDERAQPLSGEARVRQQDRVARAREKRRDIARRHQRVRSFGSRGLFTPADTGRPARHA